MFQGEETYDSVLSSIYNIMSVPKPNNCGKMYVFKYSLLNTKYLIPVVVLISYIIYSFTKCPYLIT